MHDADTFGYDEWAWGYCQVHPSSSASSSFTVAFVQVIMKSVREACNRPFSLACQKNKLSGQQCCWMRTLKLFYFLLFYRVRWLFSLTISTFNKLRYCILFLSLCQPALTFCYRGIEHKAAGAGFSVLCCTNMNQSCSECGPVKHHQHYGYVKHFYLTVTDIVLMNRWRLLNNLRVCILMETSVYFDVNICLVAPVEWKWR